MLSNPLDIFLEQLLESQGPEAVTNSLSWLGAFVVSKNGVIVSANAPMFELLQQGPEFLIGLPIFDVITNDDQEPMRERLSAADSIPYVLTLPRKEGKARQLLITPRYLNANGVDYRLSAVSDVSEVTELKGAENRFQVVFSAAGIGIARVNLHGHFLECNEKLCEILGYSEEKLLSVSFQDITHPDDLDEDLQYVQELLSGERSIYSMQKRYVHSAGHYLWVRLTVTLVKDALNEPQYFVSVVQDISAEKAAQTATEQLTQVLENLSMTDGLTGLGNRRKFDTALHNEWRRARRQGSAVSLVLADIDHFKTFNDVQGHVAGDDCLKEIAQALQQYGNRVSDCVARYGGEEFVILLPGVPLTDAIDIAENCRQAVERRRIGQSTEGDGPRVTISLGVAQLIPGEDDAPESLIDAADHRLYEAKRDGRNRVKPSPENS